MISGITAGAGLISTPLYTIPSISIEMIGPTEHIATIPKLSLRPPFLFTEARPMPSAIRNGTVIGPVVTPPESNAAGMNSGGQKQAKSAAIR